MHGGSNTVHVEAAAMEVRAAAVVMEVAGSSADGGIQQHAQWRWRQHQWGWSQ